MALELLGALLQAHDFLLIGAVAVAVALTLTVEKPDSTDGTDEEQSPSDQPFLTVSQHPSMSVSGTRVRTTVGFTNEGGPMEERWIVELELRQQGQNVLSISTSGSQDVCDPSHPENMHTEIPALDRGESVTLDLTSSVDGGQQYDVWLLTGTGCATDGGELAGPYPSGTLVDTVCVGDCSSSDGSDVPDGQGLPLWALGLVGVIGLGFIGYGVYRLNE